jgi:hypothetical protein
MSEYGWYESGPYAKEPELDLWPVDGKGNPVVLDAAEGDTKITEASFGSIEGNLTISSIWQTSGDCIVNLPEGVSCVHLPTRDSFGNTPDFVWDLEEMKKMNSLVETVRLLEEENKFLKDELKKTGWSIPL